VVRKIAIRFWHVPELKPDGKGERGLPGMGIGLPVRPRKG